MTRLNLDKTFQPLGLGIDFEEFLFPSNAEAHIKLKENVGREVLITTRIRSSQDIVTLLLATDAVRRAGAKEVSLFMPYLPYARQDRVMVPGEPLSLKVFADLINAQQYASVSVYDVHSDVAPALIDRCQNFTNHEFVRRVLEGKKNYVLVAPDAGSHKKIYKLAEVIGYTGEIIFCSKTRDVTNGKITGVEVHWTELCGYDCYIIDDICDGGYTFTTLAKELKKHEAGSISLVVSHAILSKGPQTLYNNGIDHIYCTDAFDSIAGKWKGYITDHITQIKLEDGLLSR